MLTLLTAVLPGAGLLAAGRRRTGAVVLSVFLLVITAVTVLAVAVHGMALVDRVVVDPNALLVAAAGIALVVFLWALLIVATAVAARPRPSSRAERAAGVLLVATLCLAVALPGTVAVRYALIQRSLLLSVFRPGAPGASAAPAGPSRTGDPWRSIPRVNVLLLGADAGPDRRGLRPDSVLVASVDTSTGNTLLISLPRNLENVPFPPGDPLHEVFPDGYDCGAGCLLNGIWEEARARGNLFPRDPNPGLTATRDAVSAVVGQRLDYYVLLDLQGFQRVIDALGGVAVDVPRRIPIGGGTNLRTGARLPVTGYIEPGRQHLDGYHALWFARSRQGSDDYDRMRRQRCLIGDVIEQADPLTLVRAFPKLVAAVTASISTDIPRGDLPAWVQLARRIQAARVTSLAITPDVTHPGNPDFARIRALVRRAMAESTADTAGRPSSAAPSAAATFAPKSSPSPSLPAAADLAQVC